MVLNLFKSEQPPLPSRVNGERIYIRLPEKADAKSWVEVRSRNAGFLKPWSPAGAMANIDRDGFMKRLPCYVDDWKDDLAYTFFIFRQDSDALIGGITINNIVRGAGQMGTLGYWLDEAETRQGFMTEAVLLAAEFAFSCLRLHRLQAGTLPENMASQKVLMNSGFRPEGLARKYIRINGEWRDHQMFSLIVDEFISLGAF